jgi:hypothetical protein
VGAASQMTTRLVVNCGGNARMRWHVRPLRMDRPRNERETGVVCAGPSNALYVGSAGLHRMASMMLTNNLEVSAMVWKLTCLDECTRALCNRSR